MCRPSPVPPRLRRVVKNGSKARRWTSSLMPMPSSANGDLDVVGADPPRRQPHGAGRARPERRARRVEDKVGQHLAVGPGIAVHDDARRDVDRERDRRSLQRRAQAGDDLLGRFAQIERRGVRRGCGRPRPA